MYKTYFNYGAMSSGKTLQLLSAIINYRMKNANVLIMSPQQDNRAGVGVIKTRVEGMKPIKVDFVISEFNDELYKGHEYEALERLLKQNPFPEFTGRVCPALCEKACLNGYDGQPVTIHDNELYIIENGFEKGWVQANPPKVGQLIISIN